MSFFSVIISVYNKSKTIQDTLQSALNQTFIDFEIIIIDDGSKDESASVIATFNDARINYFYQENAGVSVARNSGIEKSAGKVIAFLDADDYWCPNHLQVLHDLIQQNPDAGIFASRYISKVAENKFLKNHFLNLAENYGGIVPDFFHSSLINRIALTSAVAIPKTVLDENGVFNPEIFSVEDLDLWIRIALKYPVAITNTVTVEYNAMDNNSISKLDIHDKKLIDLSKFKKAEDSNKSLKAFLDVNRMDYALKFKISGNLKSSKEYYNAIAKENITLKNWLVYHMPRWIQLPLLKFKKKLLKNGVDFSVYR